MDNLAVRGVDPAVVGGKGAPGGGDIADGSIVIGAAALKLAALRFETDDGVRKRPVGDGDVARAKALIVALDITFVGAVDDVEADRQLAIDLAVQIQLHPIGAEAVVEGEALIRGDKARAFRGRGRLATRRGVTKHEGVGALAEVEALDVIGVGRHHPREKIARGERGKNVAAAPAGEAAKGQPVVVTLGLDARDRGYSRDEGGGILQIEHADVVHEIAGEHIHRHRHFHQFLSGAVAEERGGGAPLVVDGFRYFEGRELNHLSQLFRRRPRGGRINARGGARFLGQNGSSPDSDRPGPGILDPHQGRAREHRVERRAGRHLALHGLGPHVLHRVRWEENLAARLLGKPLERLLSGVRREIEQLLDRLRGEQRGPRNTGQQQGAGADSSKEGSWLS